MTTTERHRHGLVQLWMDLGLSRRDAERAADGDLRLADVFRQQGMSKVEIRQALQKLRAVFDVIEVDQRTRRWRLVTDGKSIFDTKGKTRTKKGE